MNETTPSLFDLESPVAAKGLLPDLPIRPDQVEEIRTAFELAGINDQEQRQELVQSVVARQLQSLRDLQAVEAHRILKRIKDRQTSKPPTTGSAWDNRDEDTWIDKL